MGPRLVVVLVAGALIDAPARQASPADGAVRGRPVAVWPSGPLEVVAAFDRAVAPAEVKAMMGVTIPYDEIQPGRPGDSSVAGPAGRLRIVGARLQDDGRTLVLATDPHPRQARYHLALPTEHSGPVSKDRGPETVTYDLSGVEAVWNEGDDPAGEPAWKGWWPAPNSETTRRLTRGSRPHERAWPLLARSGRLVLSGWVRLPQGKATVRIQSSGPIEEALLGDLQADGRGPDNDRRFHAELTAESRGEPLFFTTTCRTGTAGRPFSIDVSYRMAGEAADHPIDRDRSLLPWVPASSSAATPAPIALPDLSGGDPGRGRTIYRGDQARCAQCHAFRGEGGQVGPDLTQIASKGRAEIYRSIAAPSAAIAPDYTTYTVATRNGQVLSGVVRAENADEIKVTDTNARAAIVRRDQIQEIRPSATSIMPPGLAAALGDSAVRDLIAYLTSPAPPTPTSRP